MPFPNSPKIPAQFATLFDRVFGERHWSVQCVTRSSIASIAASIPAFAILASIDPAVLASWGGDSAWDMIQTVVAVGFLSIYANVIPDYVSLFETRLVIRYMRGSVRRILGLLALDAILTTALSLTWVWAFFTLGMVGRKETPIDLWSIALGTGTPGTVSSVWVPVATVYFYSAFFTSIWLWIYTASVLVSRVLLRMNNGVGFLLQVTDVEKQPFRSMGFVSVIIVSALFALGLPLVLL